MKRHAPAFTVRSRWLITAEPSISAHPAAEVVRAYGSFSRGPLINERYVESVMPRCGPAGVQKRYRPLSSLAVRSLPRNAARRSRSRLPSESAQKYHPLVARSRKCRAAADGDPNRLPAASI